MARLPTLSRLQVVEALPGEFGQRIIVLDWWRELLAQLDAPGIVFLLVLLTRQSGKSQAALHAAVSELLTKRAGFVLYVSASQAQAQAVVARKLHGPLKSLLASQGIAASAVRFTQRGVELPALGSVLEIVAANEATVPGRTPTLLILDESKDIDDRVFTALVPSVIGGKGKVLIIGSAGPPKGFFYELVEHAAEDPEVWVYRSAENENPHASRTVLGFLKKTLARLFPVAAQRELGNEFAEDGDSFLPPALVDAAVDDRLTELASSDRPAFAFLDLSRKRDLTSLVVVTTERARRPEAADHAVVASLQVWDPKQSPTKETPFDEVRAALAALPVRFPNLRRVLVDEGAEAGSVLPWAKAHPRLALRVEGFVASATSNMDLWGALAARLHAQTIAIPRHERLLAELKSLKQESFAFGSKFRIVDSSNRLHRDVSVSLAGACFAAGAARTCRSPLCHDENCDGTPGHGLLFTEESLAWRARHPSAEDLAALAAAEAAVDAEDAQASEAAAVETEAETEAGGLLDYVAEMARAGFSRLAQQSAARALRQAEDARTREERLAAHLVAQRDRQERATEQAAQARAAAELRTRVRRGGGVWFPGD